MNRGRLISGIVLLVIAGLLEVLNIVLPDEKLMFMVGDTIMSYVPPIMLGIIGIVLLATVRR